MQSPHIKELLGKDHYSLVANEMIHKPDFRELEPEFVEKMKEFRALGNNVLASSEYLIRLKKAQCRQWKQFVTELNFRLEIAMVHRHWHQCLPSLWNQYNKYKRIHGKPISSHEDWPGINNDTRISTFEEFLDDFSPSYVDKYNTLQPALDCWQDIADRVTVFDLHESRLMLGDGRVVDKHPDMVRNFICSVLPGAKHTCDDYDLHATTIRGNEAENLDYDILAVHAYESGLITDKSLRRKVVAEKTSRYAVSNNITLPLECPSKDVLDDIYRNSLHVEKWAKSRAQFSKGNEEELLLDQLEEFNTDWEATVAKNKFCNVDAAKALEDEKWQTFFRGLKSG
jgi:hypothetical protein